MLLIVSHYRTKIYQLPVFRSGKSGKLPIRQCQWKGGRIMRIIALVLALLTGVVGFVVSYGIAYREVSGMLYSSTATMQTSASFNNNR